MNDFDPSLSDFKNTNRISHLSPFTPREIDIIACLIHGRAPKKIAVLLSLSPKTIENHIHNMMLKAECNSREGILDYVEKAGYMPLLRQHYGRLNLLAFTEEQEEIKQIPAYFQGSIKNKRMIWIISATSFLALLGGGVFLSAQLWTKKTTEFIARSDFSLPAKHVRLDRPDLISQIDMHFKERKDEIQTVALVGIGGAGKTTLARSYAHSQNISVIWEINAETPETISTSFEHLAYFLGKSTEDKKTLSVLQEAKNSKAREQLLIQFVKDHLKELESWLLIYDNVPKMADIKNYFPTDPQTWGKGKILITTQDGTVKNNKYVAHTIQVEELSKKEKKDLFTNILYEHNPSEKNNLKSVSGFLKKIPSFPLDVSIAACYLKTTNLSFDDYLERLALPPEEFDKVQQDLLKETSEYKKTRYGIITLALQKIISAHKDFEELLLFISLLHSQNIPREWLNSYKDEITVDSFIHHLKKYSLITDKFSPTALTLSFSIHRSTQEIVRDYLNKRMNSEKNKKATELILLVLGNYLSKNTDEENILKFKLLINHYQAFSFHANVLSCCAKGILLGELCYIYRSLSNNENNRKMVESLNLLNQCSASVPLARTLAYLGYVYWAIGEFDKSQEILEKSLKMYAELNNKDHIGMARTYGFLGMLLSDKGRNDKAQLFYEKALIIYKKYMPKNFAPQASTLLHLGSALLRMEMFDKAQANIQASIHISQNYLTNPNVITGWAFFELGNLYQRLGNFEKSIDYCKQGFIIYKKHYPTNSLNMAWALRNLGSTHTSLQNFREGKALLEKSLKIFKAHLGNDNIKTQWVFFELGKTYRGLGEIEKAKNIFKKCLKIYKLNYGENHCMLALVLMNLGETYLLENKLEMAEKSFYKSLKIYAKHKKNNAFLLEDLAELYLKKSTSTLRNGDIVQSKKLRKEAHSFLTQALEAIKTYFPSDCPHVIRIQSKLKELKSK
jgi:tetratricopeptide (TPR) repeat protein/DNA-binding CsgD family transcriptional regulator